MSILSIDPGKQNGVAVYGIDQLLYLETLTLMGLLEFFMVDVQLHGVDLVVIEDSRMQTHIFNTYAAKGSKVTGMKVARDIGGIDKICELIQALCDEKKITMVSVSPKKKGRKLDAKEFELITGWDGRTNQHERDAAMVGWPYRNAAKVA